jgi:peptide/nickel transport system substrate-binding protein
VGNENNYWTRRFNRRSVIRGAGLGAAGLAGAALIGCGSDDDSGATSRVGDIGGNVAATIAPAIATTVASDVAVPADQVRLEPGIYDGAVAASKAEANPAVNAKYGGSITMRYLDPPRMDLNRTLSCTIFHTLNYTNNRLVRGKTGANAPLSSVNLEPDLAESWEAQDGGRQFTFNLRKGIKTHNKAPTNGRQFTSEDVVSGLEMYKAGGTQKDVYSAVTDISAPDEDTVVVKLNQPVLGFPGNHASWSFIYAKELSENEDARQTENSGTGPFIQTEWTSKERSVFTKNPDYMEEGLPYLDEVIAVVQGDANVLRAGFQTDNFLDWSPRDDAEIEEMAGIRGDTMVANKFPNARGATVYGFQFQMNNPTFQDERVRRALSLAFDRTEFDEAFTGGDNRHPNGPYSNSPMPWAYLWDEFPNAEVNGPYYQFDPAQASQMMQAAGYTADNPLQMEMVSYYYRNQLSELVIPGIVANLPEVDIAWRQVDNPTHVTLMSDRNFDDTIGFLWGPPGYSMDQWIFPFMHSTGGNNYGSINDPTLDALLEKQRAETDVATQKEQWHSISERIHDQVFQAWFPERGRRSAWHNYMLNYRYHALMGSYVCYSNDQARSIWLDDGAPGDRKLDR